MISSVCDDSSMTLIWSLSCQCTISLLQKILDLTMKASSAVGLASPKQPPTRAASPAGYLWEPSALRALLSPTTLSPSLPISFLSFITTVAVASAFSSDLHHRCRHLVRPLVWSPRSSPSAPMSSYFSLWLSRFSFFAPFRAPLDLEISSICLVLSFGVETRVVASFCLFSEDFLMSISF